VGESPGSRSRPASVIALMCALGFQGLSGLAGGVGLIGDPTGAALSIPQEWLMDSPFRDYRVPGLILLTGLGVLPLVVAGAVWSAARWALAASLLIGLMLVVWIGVQISIVGYQASPPLQAVYGSLGLVIAALTRMPSVRKYFRSSPPG
jgi:hypothetical protein